MQSNEHMYKDSLYFLTQWASSLTDKESIANVKADIFLTECMTTLESILTPTFQWEWSKLKWGHRCIWGTHNLTHCPIFSPLSLSQMILKFRLALGKKITLPSANLETDSKNLIRWWRRQEWQQWMQCQSRRKVRNISLPFPASDAVSPSSFPPDTLMLITSLCCV